MADLSFYNDLDKLLNVMPSIITNSLNKDELDDLVELVMDLGRKPEARFSTGDIKYISDNIITDDDINFENNHLIWIDIL